MPSVDSVTPPQNSPPFNPETADQPNQEPKGQQAQSQKKSGPVQSDRLKFSDSPESTASKPQASTPSQAPVRNEQTRQSPQNFGQAQNIKSQGSVGKSAAGGAKSNVASAKDFAKKEASIDPKQLVQAGQRLRENPRDVSAALDIAENIPASAPYVKGLRLAEKAGGIDEQELIDAVVHRDNIKLAEIAAKATLKATVREVALYLILGLLTAAMAIGLVFIIIAAICKLAPLGISNVFSICRNVNSYVSNITASAGLGSSAGGGGGGGGGGRCSPVTSGPATVENLSQTCFGANAQQASDIASVESGGNPLIGSGSDKCTVDGQSVSWGLFQINISSHKIGNLDCPAAFNHPFTAGRKDCQVINQPLYDQCVAAMKDPAQNIAEACKISGNGVNWSAWGANSVCKF